MDPFQRQYQTTPSSRFGSLLAAAVLAIIGGAIYWAIGPQRTQRDLAACKARYANSHTAAESLLVDSMHVRTQIPRQTVFRNQDSRCAAFR